MPISSSSAIGNAGEMQWLPSVNIDGLGSIGYFDKFSGGDATANPPKSRPGGMGPEITYLALPVFSDVVVERTYVQERDNGIISTVRTLVGTTYGTVTVQPLDQNGNPNGTPRTYRGRIASVNDGNSDSNSANPRMWQLHFTIESVAN